LFRFLFFYFVLFCFVLFCSVLFFLLYFISNINNPNFHKGSVFCDITSEEPNFGCAEGMYCKREFIFYPNTTDHFQNMIFSPYGLCAPRTKVQLPNKYPCTLHSECLSGYCSFSRNVKVGDEIVSAADRYYRGNMEVDKVTIRGEEIEARRESLIGRCMKVRKTRQIEQKETKENKESSK
jgi:hypothetical protein